jgi:hypothetical protein
MKSELQSKQSILKELQNDLQRLKIASERRQSKAQRIGDEQRAAIASQQQLFLAGIRQLSEKLKKEVLQLTDKKRLLSVTLSEEYGEGDRGKRAAGVGKARGEARRREERARRQLESDEKKSFSKLFEARKEGMQKRLAEEVFAPRMERIVSENKQRVAAERERVEERLNKLRSPLPLLHYLFSIIYLFSTTSSTLSLLSFSQFLFIKFGLFFYHAIQMYLDFDDNNNL